MMKKTLSYIFLSLIFFAGASKVHGQYMTTVAGNGTGGYTVDGVAATIAEINNPNHIAVDAAGNIYIADAQNNRIRKVSIATGLISTIAGTGVAGFSGDGFPAIAAKVNAPCGIALDAAGNIYFSDQGNHRVRKITIATGNISSVAGNGAGTYGSDGVAATSTSINNPAGIVLDGANNIYIADRDNNRIRKVTAATGLISTIAGTGTAGFSGDAAAAVAATLNMPQAVAFDPSGNLYIADGGNNRIRKITTASGNINTVAGNGTVTYGGEGVSALATGFNTPMDVAFDASGNYYVADQGNSRIRKITISSGLVTTATGTGTAGYNGDCISPSAAEINMPVGVAFDASDNLYISDQANSRVREIVPPCSGTPSTGIITSTLTTGCNSYTPTISLNGASTGCDITYQWQSSTDGTTYTSIGGATNISYTTLLTVSSYFKCVVSCVSTGTFFSSTSIYLNVDHPLTVPAITGPSSVCIGSSITLSDTATLGGWTATGGHGTLSSGGVFSGTSAGLDTIMYSESNVCGTYAANIIVSVNPIVAPSVFISANPGTTVCPSTLTTFTALPTYGGASPAYVWHVNGATTGAGATFSYTPSNGDTVTCNLTSNASCLSTTTAVYSVEITVQASILPAVAINDAPWGDSVCIGNSVTWYALPTNGGSTPTYQWSVNGINTGTGSSYTHVPANGDAIAVTMTSSMLCASPMTVSTVDTMTVDLTEVPSLTITANTGDTSCTGYAVTFMAHPVYGGPTPQFHWIKNGVHVATGPTYSYIPTTGDSVKCVLYSSATCRTIDSAVSNAVYMTVVGYSAASILATTSPGSYIRYGQLDTFVAIVANAGSSSSYQWYNSGVVIPGATSATFVSDSLGDMDSIYCVVHCSNPCAIPSVLTSNSTIIHITNLGVHDMLTSIGAISLVPNPNTGNFTIAGSVSGTEANVTVEITNLLGRVVYSGTADVINGAIKKHINVAADLANGVYVLEVISNNDRKIVRFTLNK